MDFPQRHLEQKPDLGSKKHVRDFLEWTERHKLRSFGKLTFDLIFDQSDQLLLGGILKFLSHAQTAEILSRWSEDCKMASFLLRASRLIFLDFPAAQTLGASAKVASVFRGKLESDYLACHLSTRVPAIQDPPGQLAVHALRTWLLVKSFEYAKQGVPFDRNLQSICTQLRMACDC